MSETATLHEIQPLAVIRLMDGTDMSCRVDHLTFQDHGIRVWDDVSHKHSRFYPFANVQWVQT